MARKPSFNEQLTRLPEAQGINAKPRQIGMEAQSKFFQNISNLFSEAASNKRELELKQRERRVREEAQEKGIEEGLESAEKDEAPDLKEDPTTIYQREFNNQSVDAWQSEIQNTIYQEAENLYEKHSADPQKYESKFNEQIKNMEQELPEDMIPKFRNTARRQKQRYMKKVENNYLEQHRAKMQTELNDSVEKMKASIRDFSESAPFSDLSKKNLGEEFLNLYDTLKDYGPKNKTTVNGLELGGGNGFLKSSKVAEVYRGTKRLAVSNIIMSKFKNKDTKKEMENFRRQFKSDPISPEGKKTIKTDDSVLSKENQDIQTGSRLIIDKKTKQDLLKRMNDMLGKMEKSKEVDVSKAIDELQQTQKYLDDPFANLSEQDINEYNKNLNLVKEYEPEKASEFQVDTRFLKARKMKFEDEDGNTKNLFLNQIKKNKGLTELINKKSELQTEKNTGDYGDQGIEVISTKIDYLDDIIDAYSKEPLATAKRLGRIDKSDGVERINLNNLPTSMDEISEKAVQKRVEKLDYGLIDKEEISLEIKQNKVLQNMQNEVIEKWKTKLKNRRKWVNNLSKSEFISKSEAFWFGNEKKQISNFLKDPETNAGEKLKLGKMIVEAAGPMHKEALRAVDSNNTVFKHAVGLYAGPNDKHSERIANDMFKGQDLLDQEVVFLPKQEELTATFNEVYDDAFKKMKFTRKNVMQAAKAHYAQNVKLEQSVSEDGVSLLDEDQWKRSIKKAVDARKDDETGVWYGGPATFREQKILLPKGVSAEKFKAKINSIRPGNKDVKNSIFEKKSIDNSKPVLAKPDGETKKFKKKHFYNSNTKLVSKGNNKYQIMIYDNENNWIPVKSSNPLRENYVMDLSNLKDIKTDVESTLESLNPFD